MKNRVFLVLLAVMLVLSVGLAGCGGEQVPEVTEYGLTLSSTQGGSVITPGEGTGSFIYDEGEVVDIVAQADADYHFVNWTCDVSTIADANDATTTITVDNHYSITANFARGPAIPFKNPDSFVQMTIAEPESLDPTWGWGAGGQVQYIYETLVFWEGEKTDQFVPVLATEWELLDDNVTYRFKIREGVKFHEGGDLTPEDVEYSFQRAMVQDAYAAPACTFFWLLLGAGGSGEVTFADIDGAVEVAGDWVVFHLCDPAWALPFLQIICCPWASIVDKEWCIASGDWDGTEATWLTYNHPQNPVDTVLFDNTNGTGPWKLEEWDPGVHIKLVRNDDYWREPAAFETVITQIVEEWTTREAALLAGDADLVYSSLLCYSGGYPELEAIEALERIEGLNVYEDLPQLVTYGLFPNFDISNESEFIGSGALDGDGIPTDFFSDIDVRKGFCYAFDYETYIEDGRLGDAEQRGSPIIEGLPFYNPNASMYSHDLDKAEEHMRLARDGEVWERGFKFTMLYIPGNLARKTACEIVAENLYAINSKFQVNIQPMDWETYKEKVIDTRMPLFQVGFVPDYPHPNNVLSVFMDSTRALAYTQGYGSPELDQLIEDAFKEADPAVQKDLYYELQERYYEDAPAIMLCQPLGRCYFTKYIQGFYFNPFIGAFAGLPLYYMSKSES